MRIMNIANYTNQKQNQPAFGMKLEIADDAIEIVKKWFTKEDFQKNMPEIEALKTKLGDEIFLKIEKNTDKSLKLSANVREGILATKKNICNDKIFTDKEAKAIKMGSRPKTIPLIKKFVMELWKIKNEIDFKITPKDEINHSAEFVEKIFG